MAITIKKVSSKKELKTFIRFNYELYKENPYSVPDLYDDMLNTFSPKKNAAFEFCEAEYFLAYKDNKVVGRIAGIINKRANETWNKKEVRFGWIDFLDDIEISRALLDAVAQWGKSKGMDTIQGPLGFTDFDAEGMRLYTNVFQKLGIGFAVVNNLDGYDEISLTDEFKVMTNHYETIYKPSELGFSLARQEELYGGNTPEEASKIFNNVLENKATKAQTDCVLINASFAIQAMEPAKPIEECVAIARESLESGKALNTLKKFVELNS